MSRALALACLVSVSLAAQGGGQGSPETLRYPILLPTHHSGQIWIEATDINLAIPWRQQDIFPGQPVETAISGSTVYMRDGTVYEATLPTWHLAQTVRWTLEYWADPPAPAAAAFFKTSQLLAAGCNNVNELVLIRVADFAPPVGDGGAVRVYQSINYFGAHTGTMLHVDTGHRHWTNTGAQILVHTRVAVCATTEELQP